MTGTPAATELRLAATARGYGQPLAFYRDVPGLPKRAAYELPGASVIAGPVTIPWQSLNARLQRPAGLQLTLSSPTSRRARQPAADSQPCRRRNPHHTREQAR